MRQLVIIGGGMAGLSSAIASARELRFRHISDTAVIVLDAMDVPGKKLLVTGNGRCNISNRRQSRECYRSGGGLIPDRYYQPGWDTETEEFMRSIGVLLQERRGGMYPRTGQAQTVQQSLWREAKRLGVTLESGVRVTSCGRQSVGRYLLKYDRSSSAHGAESGAAAADRVIIAAGGLVSGAYGCVGDGYRMAQSLGHTLVPPVPALCALQSDSSNLRLASGVRAYGGIRLMCGTRQIACSEGELQLTEHGISGIPAFQVSRYAAYACREGLPRKPGSNSGDNAKEGRRTSACAGAEELAAELDFLPEMSLNAWETECERRLAAIHPSDTLGDFCRGLIPDKAAAWILADRGLVREKKIINLNRQTDPDAAQERLRQILNDMRGKRIRITGTESFEKAQVTAGGISLDDLDNHLESRLAPGCFMAGELLDVDGMCGGYNLTWAVHSGLLAGRSAAQSL